MRVGNFTFEGPSPGSRGIYRGPRQAVEPAIGGTVHHVHDGYRGDEPVSFSWDAMDASPSISIVRTYADVAVACNNIIPGERLAYRIPVAAGDFYGISAARLYLSQNGAAAGYVTVEMWSGTAATNTPNEYLGTIGYIDVDDIPVTANYAAFERFSWDVAFPADPTLAYLVLCGEALTAGIVYWGGNAGAPANGYAKYTAAAWGALAGELSATVWSGGPYLIWRGLWQTSDGTYAIDLEDGQLYTGTILDVDGRVAVRPSPRGGTITTAPASAGIAERVTVTLGLTDELD